MFFFFFSSRRRHTRSVSAFLLNRSSDLITCRRSDVMSKGKKRSGARPGRPQPLRGTKGKRKGARLWYVRSEERFSRNAETDLVCRLLLEKKKKKPKPVYNNKQDFMKQIQNST